MKSLSVFLSAALFVQSTVGYSQDLGENPKCHVYLKSSGYVVNVRSIVRTTYTSADVCGNTLKNYVCYSYFEPEETCNTSNVEMIDQFIGEAMRDNKLI